MNFINQHLSVISTLISIKRSWLNKAKERFETKLKLSTVAKPKNQNSFGIDRKKKKKNRAHSRTDYFRKIRFDYRLPSKRQDRYSIGKKVVVQYRPNI